MSFSNWLQIVQCISALWSYHVKEWNFYRISTIGMHTIQETISSIRWAINSTKNTSQMYRKTDHIVAWMTISSNLNNGTKKNIDYFIKLILLQYTGMKSLGIDWNRASVLDIVHAFDHIDFREQIDRFCFHEDAIFEVMHQKIILLFKHKNKRK